MKSVVLAVLICVSSVAARADESHNLNFRFSPILLLVGAIHGVVDYKVTNNVVVGGEIMTWNLSFSDYTFKASGFGASAKYYFDQAYVDGWYAGGRFVSSSFEATAKDSLGNKESASASGTSFGAIGGYHWFWDSFNLNLGATIVSSSVTSVDVKDSNGVVVRKVDNPGASAGLDFMLGFTF